MFLKVYSKQKVLSLLKQDPSEIEKNDPRDCFVYQWA